MRPDRHHLVPDLLLLLAGLAGWALFASWPELFEAIEQNFPAWLEPQVALFVLGGTFIGLASLAFSALFDAGRWHIQVLLIAAGVGMYGLAQWWFWLDRGKPIIFHPGLLLIILAAAAVFSGVVSLAWGLFNRSPAARSGPGKRLRRLAKFWPVPVVIVVIIALLVGREEWRNSRAEPVLRNIAGRDQVATDLNVHYEGEWKTWTIRCPEQDPRLAPEEMGIEFAGPEGQELKTYPRVQLDGCTQPVDPGPHPISQRMFTSGVQPAVIVDELPGS